MKIVTTVSSLFTGCYYPDEYRGTVPCVSFQRITLFRGPTDPTVNSEQFSNADEFYCQLITLVDRVVFALIYNTDARRSARYRDVLRLARYVIVPVLPANDRYPFVQLVKENAIKAIM